MIRGYCILALIAAMPVAAAAQGGQPPVEPVVRATLEPAGTVTIGQPVHLHVDIFVPTFFMQPPSLPPIELESAVATLEEGAVNTNDRVDGETWSGIRRDYRIEAQAPGTIRIPPVPISVRYAIDGRLSDPFTVPTPALTFEARLPAGAEGLAYFFAAPQLRLTEHFDRRPASLRVGDAFTRTVTMTASDVTAIALPPLPLQAPDGLSLQMDPPRLTTQRGDRGQASTVSRTERATYTAVRAGHYVVPAVEVRYWNSAEARVVAVSLPALTFDVSDEVAFGEEIALPPEPVPQATTRAAWIRLIARRWRLLVVTVVLLVAVVWLARRLVPRAVSAWRAATAASAESESHYFELVTRAARQGDLRALHAAALAWLARVPGLDVATLSGLAAQTGDVQLAGDVAALGRVLYARGAGGTGDDALAARLLVGLTRARRRLSAPRRAERDALAPLNPA